MSAINLIIKVEAVLSGILFCINSFLIFNTPLAVSADYVESAPVNYVGKGAVPALFSAIQKEDIDLYSEEVKGLLNGPIKEFIETIKFKTKEGDNIFHLMAGVHSHQEFFVKEMQNLKAIFSQEGSARVSHLTLGGVTISIPNIEDTELGQTAENKDVVAFISAVDHLEEVSAIEWLKNFHARTKNGQSLKEFILEHFEMSPLLYLWDQNLSAIESYPEISSFLLVKNNEGLSPKDTAYKSDNFFAYTFIFDHVENLGRISRDNLKKLGFGIGASLGVGLSLGWGSVPYSLDSIGQTLLFKPLEAMGYGYLAGLVSGPSVQKCYDVFQKMKVKKLRKKSDRKRRHL